MNKPPPVAPGPFFQPWPTRDNPQSFRPARPNFPIQGGGGVFVPPGSNAVYSVDFAAIFNGTKVFPVTTVSQLILAAPNMYRNLLYIRNSGASNIFLDFGQDASTLSIARLEPNEQLLFDTRVPQDDIYVIGAGPSTVSIAFSVIAPPSP